MPRSCTLWQNIEFWYGETYDLRDSKKSRSRKKFPRISSDREIQDGRHRKPWIITEIPIYNQNAHVIHQTWGLGAWKTHFWHQNLFSTPYSTINSMFFKMAATISSYPRKANIWPKFMCDTSNVGFWGMKNSFLASKFIFGIIFNNWWHIFQNGGHHIKLLYKIR